MAEAPKINQGGPAFQELGNVAYNSEWQSESGMSLRQYYAAHCPMTMSEAYEIWAGNRESADQRDPRFRDSMMSLGLRRAGERLGFFDWWATMRFEYADAMIAEGKGGR